MEEASDDDPYDPLDVPMYVEAVPRLKEDVAALLRLCNTDSPPWRRVRPQKTSAVLYGFGDASGPAYGASSAIPGVRDLHFEYGQWTTTIAEEESSNWREFTNLVEYLDGRAAEGELDNAEVFMFTDNSTAESAFWKGNSHSRKLSELVLRLRELEMNTGAIIHIVHVSGRRMIAQGTDGLSRGDHSSGVMQGDSIQSFVPLHLDAFERAPVVKRWLNNLLSPLKPDFLDKEGWFKGTDREGTFVWCPPPAAAEVVVERLGIARHKRPNSLHLVVVPRLMTGRWRKHLLKSIDFYFRLDCPELWDLEVQFEPLLIFCALPFLPHRPNFEAKADLVKRFQRLLLSDGVQRIHSSASRSVLRKLFLQARALPTL